MTLTAALLLIAQAATGSGAVESSAFSQSSAPRAVASATASVRIVRPARVRVSPLKNTVEIEAPDTRKPQKQRDKAGTLWIEFS